MIDVNGLEKCFRAVYALRGVSFAADDSATTGLVGPNGAGKTTTLRIFYTVLRPDTGCATVDGFDTGTARREVQRHIGVLADSEGLYPRLTSREHVRYFGRLHSMKGAALENRIDELFKMLEMGDIADRRAQGFSKGQTMKVALARALAHRSHNVLLEEPTNGLDVAGPGHPRPYPPHSRRGSLCAVFQPYRVRGRAVVRQADGIRRRPGHC